MKVTLAGTGCGSMYTMTAGVVKAIREAGMIIGASRLLDSLPEEWGGQRVAAISADEILSRINEYRENHLAEGDDMDPVCVVFSGDAGFYSGARPLLPLLEEYGIEAEVLPGISSIQMLSARLKRPWQDWKLVSAHGIDCDVAESLSDGEPTFFLTGGDLGPAEICTRLVEAGKGELEVTIAEKLSYDDEEIIRGKATDFTGADFDSLSVILVEAEEADPREEEGPVAAEEAGDAMKEVKSFRAGLPDYLFIRGDVPMTKRDVRAVIAGHMQIMEDDVIWDVGAGTGSVTCEMAIQATGGKVYAVEKDRDGITLIEQNAERFGLKNIETVYGEAPEALMDLPAPDRVFIGGSDGRMSEILDVALEKNPMVFVCVSAILLETATGTMAAMESRGMNTEITQVSVSTGRGTSGKHMMIGSNPIFIMTGSMR